MLLDALICIVAYSLNFIDIVFAIDRRILEWTQKNVMVMNKANSILFIKIEVVA